MKVSAPYLAGVFDGEGCLYVHENRTKRKHGIVVTLQARACVSNTFLELLQTIQLEWGGSIHPVVSTNKQNYRLDWNGHDELLNLLREIQPFLIVKRAQVDLFLTEFAPTMRAGLRKHAALTDEQKAKRVEVKERLQTLKKE